MLPFKRLVKKQLGELLIERGIISRAQLDKALRVQKEKGGLIGQILVVLGFTKEEEIAQALTVQYATYLLGSNVRVQGDDRLMNTPSGKPDRHLLSVCGTMWW